MQASLDKDPSDGNLLETIPSGQTPDDSLAIRGKAIPTEEAIEHEYYSRMDLRLGERYTLQRSILVGCGV